MSLNSLICKFNVKCGLLVTFRIIHNIISSYLRIVSSSCSLFAFSPSFIPPAYLSSDYPAQFYFFSLLSFLRYMHGLSVCVNPFLLHPTWKAYFESGLKLFWLSVVSRYTLNLGLTLNRKFSYSPVYSLMSFLTKSSKNNPNTHSPSFCTNPPCPCPPIGLC